MEHYIQTPSYATTPNNVHRETQKGLKRTGECLLKTCQVFFFNQVHDVLNKNARKLVNVSSWTLAFICLVYLGCKHKGSTELHVPGLRAFSKK